MQFLIASIVILSPVKNVKKAMLSMVVCANLAVNFMAPLAQPAHLLLAQPVLTTKFPFLEFASLVNLSIQVASPATLMGTVKNVILKMDSSKRMASVLHALNCMVLDVPSVIPVSV